MERGGRKIINGKGIFVLLFIILLAFFAEKSFAQVPNIVSQSPADQALNILINIRITIQFNMTMNTNPGAGSINLQDEHGQDVAGSIQWSTTTNPNDTLVFIPQNGLKPATGYSYQGYAQSPTGGTTWLGASFITKYSYADATPPTIQTVYPYNNMTNVWTGETIGIRFSEAMNPSSITTAGYITLTGTGISGTSDYSVKYDIGSGDVKIKKNTPFSPLSSYTVTITTNVKDMRGNPLSTPYSWGFQTGSADTVAPVVTQTIPKTTPQDTKVNSSNPPPTLYAIFSKKMDKSTFNSTNITLYDNTGATGVPINIYDSGKDYVSFGPQQNLTISHQYTVTIGTGVKDMAGNGLSAQFSWSFTTAGSGVDSDPVLNAGISPNDQRGQRWFDGTTRVQLQLSAWDNITNPLTVTATTPGHAPWTLNGTGQYSYESTGEENLS